MVDYESDVARVMFCPDCNKKVCGIKDAVAVRQAYDGARLQKSRNTEYIRKILGK